MKPDEINDSDYPSEITEKLFFGLDETEMIVIKSHLFTEYMLDKYISKLNKSDSEIDKFNFTFYHKINISKILGLFENDKELDEFIINLNKLRNQIAHKMNYDNFLYDKIVEYPALYDETKWETKEKFRIGMMMLKSNYMCGKIQGKIDKYEVELKNKNCR